ncbi:hypothetical protein JCM10207_003811 [Rhodosporidiobolus poonsookiae]
MSLARSLLPRALTSALARPSPRPRLPLPSALASVWRPPLRPFSSSPLLSNAPAPPPQHTLNGPSTPIGQLDRRLQITFTCTAPLDPADGEEEGKACGHRSSHEFSKRSYERGVVIVQCPGCSNRHLIADHLSWFSSTPSPAHPTGQPIGGSTPRTVESLAKENGEEVRWIVRERTEADGGVTIEVGEGVPMEGDVVVKVGQAGEPQEEGEKAQ